MAFKIEAVPVKELNAMYSVSKDTMLSRVCRSLVAAMADVDEDHGSPLYSLDMLEQGISADDNDDDLFFQDWQIRQRDRRTNGEKVQVITIDAIARKLNAEKDETGIKAVRRNGGLFLVHSTSDEQDDADLDQDGDDS